MLIKIELGLIIYRYFCRVLKGDLCYIKKL